MYSLFPVPLQELLRLVGEVKKWEDRKWRSDRKVERYKRFSFFSLICLVGRMENEVNINLQLCPY